jgi:hypothetical protein
MLRTRCMRVVVELRAREAELEMLLGLGLKIIPVKLESFCVHGRVFDLLRMSSIETLIAVMEAVGGLDAFLVLEYLYSSGS